MVMDVNIHPEFDGAISIGALPAQKIRILLNDSDVDAEQAVRALTLTQASKKLEAKRDYHKLQFNRDLVLYQDRVTLNRKARRYLEMNVESDRVSEPVSIRGIFGFDRQYEELKFGSLITVDGFQIGSGWAELDDARPENADRRQAYSSDTRIEETVTIMHDKKSARYAPTLGLGRDFFSDCSEMLIDKMNVDEHEQLVTAVKCVSRSTEASSPIPAASVRR